MPLKIQIQQFISLLIHYKWDTAELKQIVGMKICKQTFEMLFQNCLRGMGGDKTKDTQLA